PCRGRVARLARRAGAAASFARAPARRRVSRGVRAMGVTAADEQAALARADALDAQGRHTDAVDVLAGAARRGGMRARARLGARLLMGDRAPLLGPDGVRLLAEAGAAGLGDAAALSAVL